MDTLFFSASKVIWSLIQPGNLLLLLTLLSCLGLLCGAGRWARRLLGLSLLCLTLIAVTPAGEWLLLPLETRFPANPKLPPKVDGIIVLGGAENAFRSAVWQQVELSDGAERFLAFLQLAGEHPEARLVFTGGSGSLLNQKDRGADVARKLFGDLRMDLSRVTFERNSRNTHENALFTRELIQPLPRENWVLITTARHMPRSVGAFCDAGWPVIPYPVDHRTTPGHGSTLRFNLSTGLANLTAAAREWTGLLAYYLTGRIPSPLPEPCR